MLPVQAEIEAKVSTGVRSVSTGVDGFHVLVASIICVLGALLACFFHMERISINLPAYSGAVQCAFCLAIASGYSHWAGYCKLRDTCLLLLWSFLLVVILPLPQYAAARTAMPFRDTLLARIDEFMGINVGAISVWAKAHPSINQFFGLCYTGLIPYTFIAMAAPPLAGKFDAARRFILSALLAVLAAGIIMACFPAVAPWTVYHYPIYDPQYRYVQELTALRSTERYIIDPGYSAGLITFPSFHVALAVLATRTLWVFRWLRVPAVLMCGLVSISTMATGWHYASDVLAGALLAFGVTALSDIAITNR